MKPQRKTSIHNEEGKGQTKRTRNADAFAKKNTKREHFLRTELTAISLPILYLRLLRTIKKIRHVEPPLADEKQPIMAI
jgi:hypothetical protein